MRRGCGSHSCVIEPPKGLGNNGPCRCPVWKLQAEINRLRAELEQREKDADRLDWLDKYCTRVSDSERYLPRHVYWGGGSHRDVRNAIDKAMEASNER